MSAPRVMLVREGFTYVGVDRRRWVVASPAHGSEVHAEKPKEAEVCRWCGDPAYTYDERGFTHPCCEHHKTKNCPGCAASKQLARRRRNPDSRV